MYTQTHTLGTVFQEEHRQCQKPPKHFLTLGKWSVVWDGMFSVEAAKVKLLRPTLPLSKTPYVGHEISRKVR